MTELVTPKINGIDKECVDLCDAINEIPGLRTTESCCGHGKTQYRIWFKVDNPEWLPSLLYFCDSRHVGFDWNCLVTTDCGMSPITFLLESESKGETAYEEATVIAENVMEHLREAK